VKETPLSEKQKASQSTIPSLAQKLVELVGMFSKGGPASDYQWWGKETPHTVYTAYPDYQSGHELFNRVVEGVLKLNPDMLSRHEVEWKLTYEFLKQQASYPDKVSGQELMNKARDHLNNLVEFRAWQHIDFPIVNLWLEGEPVSLGHVTFMPMTQQDIEQWEKDYTAWLKAIADIHVFARVHAPRDLEKALSYARAQVNVALDVLRILCFPFAPHTDTCRIDVIGEIAFSTSTPIRVDQRRFVTQIEGALGYWQPELRELMSEKLPPKLEPPPWELINRLIRKAEGPRSDMENKLLDGIHWLGESTKPDTKPARFVKIGVALEALAGGEPRKDERLQVRGITAMLAERAAFVAGKDLADRLKVDADIRKYYRWRSDIVHGGRRDISLSDIDNFGILVRRLALALLEKLDEPGSSLSTVEDLERWVITERYTLPGRS
jgi:hypothetical protein